MLHVRVHVGGSFWHQECDVMWSDFSLNGLCLLHSDIICISCFTPFCANETFTLTTQASWKRWNMSKTGIMVK